MRRLLIVVFALLAFALLPADQAQEKEAGEKQSQENQTVPGPSDTDQEALDEEDAEAGEESLESDENFIPTEKINVDSSVSFPVDI